MAEFIMGEQGQRAQAGADILVQCLINHGVDTVFAYPGGASMPIHQALTRVSPRAGCEHATIMDALIVANHHRMFRPTP